MEYQRAGNGRVRSICQHYQGNDPFFVLQNIVIHQVFVDLNRIRTVHFPMVMVPTAMFRTAMVPTDISHVALEDYMKMQISQLILKL